MQQTEHPSQATIDGLREVADWLEQHPELATVAHATVSFGYGIERNARARLTELAAALGERATESRWHDSVTISGRFAGEVRVSADAKKRALIDDAPPLPEPEAIVDPPAPLASAAEHIAS